MFAHIGLSKQNGSLWIDPASEKTGDNLPGALTNERRFPFDRHRMQVDHAKKRFVPVLQRHPLTEGAYVIADMGPVAAGWLHARKDSSHAGIVSHSARAAYARTK